MQLLTSTVRKDVYLYLPLASCQLPLPSIWSVLFPTIFSVFRARSGPKHSTSVPFSSEVAVPLSVDEKEVAFVPKLVPDLAVKALSGPHVDSAPTVLCERKHSLLPFILQMETPVLSPSTVQVNLKLPPGQVGGAAVNCPATSPEIYDDCRQRTCVAYIQNLCLVHTQ